LDQYLRTNIEIAERESLRTDLEWPQFVATDGGFRAVFNDERNAAAWLYYLCLIIPALALIGLRRATTVPGLDLRQTRALILSLALFATILNWFLLRGNLPGRLGDLGAPIALLAAWLIMPTRATRPLLASLTWTAKTAVLIVTGASVLTIGSVWHELDTTGLRDSFTKVSDRLRVVTTELGALPPPPIGDVSASTANVAEYLRACTRPSDRVLVVADAPEVLAFAARSFAAGHMTFRAGYFTLPDDQQRMLRRLRRQSVPIVVTDREEAYRENFASEFSLIDDYVSTFYEPAGELPALAGEPMRVLVRRGRVATTHFGTTGLPCFP
jgi:hypothetical protein